MNEIILFFNNISSMEKAMKLLRKKSMLLLIVMIFTSFNAYSYDKELLCDEHNDLPVGDGTDSMEMCVRFTNNEIKNGKVDWQGLITKNTTCCLKNREASQEKAAKCEADIKKAAAKCVAFDHIIKHYKRNWQTDSDAVNATPMQNQQAPNSSTNVAGSNISCTSAGIETVDYTPCKKFVDAYVAAEAATQMVHAGQSVMLQGKLMDVEADMIKDQNTATGALKAQAKGMKEQANVFAQRAALDASKLGVLYNLYSAIPKTKDLKEACEDIKEDSFDSKTLKDACDEATTISKGRFSFLKNQAALDAMKAQLMTAAVSTANNAILSKLTNDRAKEAKKAIANIEDFKPTDPFKIATEEEKTTLCEKDPSSSSCTDIGLDANYDAVSDNTIVFGSTGSGSSYTGGSASENEIANGSDGTTSGGSVPTIGSVIAEVDKSGSVESSAAGTVSSKANGGSASGGGGGGGAGSLGGQTPQKAAEGGVAQAVASKVAGYSGGDGFSVTGGLGIKGKKSGEKSDENPFGKLFGKEGTKASDVNFRDIASTKVGAKGDNIFDMISKRYGAVNSEKRLVEYELAR